MRIAIIGAGETALSAIEKAHNVGAYVIVVDNDREAPGCAVADEVVDVSPRDTIAVIDALENKNLDLCIAQAGNEYPVIAATVSETLGLPGVTATTATYCSDKYTFHNRLRNRNLRPGHCYLVNRNTPFDVTRISYPAVFKPRYGTGCNDVYYVDNMEQLIAVGNKIWNDKENASEKLPPETKENAAEFTQRIKSYMENRVSTERSVSQDDVDYLIEEAFGGTEYGVDGVIEGCNFELVLIRRKILAELPSRVAVGYTTVVPNEELRLREIITEYMKRAVEALCLKDCMLHADLMIQGRSCVAIEIALYPALAHVSDVLIPMATSVDMYKEFFAYTAGELHNFSPLQQRRLTMRFFNMENCFIHNIPDPTTLNLPEKVKIRKWDCRMKMLDYMGKIKSKRTLLERGYYILEGPSDRALDEAAEIIINSFEIK